MVVFDSSLVLFGTAVNEAAFRELISGEQQGTLAALGRCGLGLLSIGYGCVVRARNFTFDTGLRHTHQVPVPVISVGNITTGGTGKTPFVAYLARWFRDKGLKTVLLSRGYRSGPEQANDEKRVLAQLCPDVPHLQQPDRVASARRACDALQAQVLILDDGFQHRRLARNLDIVLVDALNPWGFGHLLPRGLLREPVGALARADLVVITRANQCTAEDLQALIARIRQVQDDDSIVRATYPADCLLNAEGTTAELSSLAGEPVGAFCGIGNPHAFRKTLVENGYQVAFLDSFPDHHHYRTDQLNALAETATKQKVSALLTTQKDLVKIDAGQFGPMPLWAVRIGCEIVQGGQLLEQRLQTLLENTAP